MAYNVFKRPMFKRGGPTTGTGIMSHVEPRVKAAFGFPGINFGVTQMPTQSSIDAFRKAEEERKQRISKPSIFAGPRYDMPEDFPGGFPEYRKFLKQQEQEQKEFEQGMTGGIATLEPGQTAFEKVFAPVDEEMAKKKKLLDTGGDRDTDEKDKPAYKGTDIKGEVEKESAMLKELLKDEGYSKGELALLVAGAVGTPGGISEKLAAARELALPIAKKRREEDKAITLAAYKLAKEKEREEIKAGKGTEYQRNLRDIARASANQPGEKRTADQIYDALLAAKSPGSEIRLNQLNNVATSIIDAAGDIARLKSELTTAKSEKDKARIQGDIERKLSDIRVVSDYPEFEIAFPGLKKRVGLKAGGRAHFADGTEVEDDIVTSNVSFGSGSETTSEPVQQLSYQELRDRLPPEITDDVVNLIANNAEALQEFAYIRTQDDVNGFNTKYGVNLVIPPTRT